MYRPRIPVPKTVCDPARVKRLFNELGGPYHLAKTLGAHFTSVYRWRKDGQLPMNFAQGMVEIARSLYPTYQLADEDKAYLQCDPAFIARHPELNIGAGHCACCRYRELNKVENDLSELLGESA